MDIAEAARLNAKMQLEMDTCSAIRNLGALYGFDILLDWDLRTNVARFARSDTRLEVAGACLASVSYWIERFKSA